MVLTKVIGENISYQRKRLKLTQLDLATRLHTTKDIVNRIEHGLYLINDSLLATIADILKCPLHKLFIPRSKETFNGLVHSLTFN